MKMRRGICPGCGEERAVTSRDVMRPHDGTELDRLGYRVPCPGEHKPPVRYVDRGLTTSTRRIAP